MDELITVHLTEFDSKLFMQFQKQYAFMKLMDSLGVFNVTTGSVTVHFGPAGEIGKVEVHKNFVYNKA